MYYAEKLPSNERMRFGWLAPNGDMYACSFENHIFAAKEIIAAIYGDDPLLELKRKVDFLKDRGWIYVTSHSKRHYMLSMNAMQNSAIEFIMRLEAEDLISILILEKVKINASRDEILALDNEGRL
jgi:hypothetical protein